MSAIYIWQPIVSPHIAGLAAALAERGHDVTYVANIAMSADRAAQGWQAAEAGRARVIIAPTSPDVHEVVAAAPNEAIHLTGGLRANGLIGLAQRALREQGARIWVTHEKIDDRGLVGWLKRIVYRRVYRLAQPWVERILAIGEGTDRWAAAQGFPEARLTPFTYFLQPTGPIPHPETQPFTFCYAGRLVELKRVDLLIGALQDLRHELWVLDVVGDGPLGPQLRHRAKRLGDADIRWHGTVSNGKARELIARSDCLVLPSDYDGWGAVVNEALLSGTRVICSSACGASAAVRENSFSRVFQAGNVGDLRNAIAETLGRGKVSPEEREERRRWANSALAAPAGAAYLEALIEGREVPAPWTQARQS